MTTLRPKQKGRDGLTIPGDRGTAKTRRTVYRRRWKCIVCGEIVLSEFKGHLCGHHPGARKWEGSEVMAFYVEGPAHE